MMGVWCLSSLLCPRVFYYDYKAHRQQRKWDKENLQIPKHSKTTMMRRHPSWTLANRSPLSKSYSGNPPPHDGQISSLLTDCRQRRRSWAVLLSHVFPSSSLSTTSLLSFPVLLFISFMYSHFSVFQFPSTAVVRWLCDGSALLILL